MPWELQQCGIECDVATVGTAAPLRGHRTQADLRDGDAERFSVDPMNECRDFLQLAIKEREVGVDLHAAPFILEHFGHATDETLNVALFIALAQTTRQANHNRVVL